MSSETKTPLRVAIFAREFSKRGSSASFALVSHRNRTPRQESREWRYTPKQPRQRTGPKIVILRPPTTLRCVVDTPNSLYPMLRFPDAKTGGEQRGERDMDPRTLSPTNKTIDPVGLHDIASPITQRDRGGCRYGCCTARTCCASVEKGKKGAKRERPQGRKKNQGRLLGVTDLETFRWQPPRLELGGELLNGQRLCLCLGGNHCVGRWRRGRDGGGKERGEARGSEAALALSSGKPDKLHLGKR